MLFSCFFTLSNRSAGSSKPVPQYFRLSDHFFLLNQGHHIGAILHALKDAQGNTFQCFSLNRFLAVKKLIRIQQENHKDFSADPVYNNVRN